MQPYPRAPDLVWPSHLHGTGCLSVWAMDTGFPTVVCCTCLGLGITLLWLFLVATLDFVRARVCVLAYPPLPLAGASGLCMWERVAPVSCLFWLGLAVRVFGCGLQGWWCVYEGGSVAPVPAFLAGACRLCPGTGREVSSPSLAGCVVCVCVQGSPPYPAIPGLVVWSVVRFGFPLTPACPGGSGPAGRCFPGWAL